RAVRPGSRLNCWKMKPMSRPRRRSRAAPRSFSSGTSSKNSRPAVGASSRPSRFSSVDLPDPERPTIDTWSPTSTSRSIERRISRVVKSGSWTLRATPSRRRSVIRSPLDAEAGVGAGIRERARHELQHEVALLHSPGDLDGDAVAESERDGGLHGLAIGADEVHDAGS